MQRLGSKRNNDVSYAKWGYIFILPFFIAFFIFQLVPMISTFYYSFFEYYRSGLTIIGPNPVGFENYQALFASDFPKYMGNTVIMWLLGFVPGKQFFKVVIYMPNLIMASAFAMLFFALFSTNGPVNAFLMSAGIIDEPFRFLSSVWGARGLVGLMNFLMWFGNTTILLMAAVMGISPSLFEAAELDGCTSTQTFFKITLPMIRPILVYVLITSMIGGLQMFDVPQILTNGKGAPDRTTETVIMFLNNHLYSKNFGMAGAVSVILFIICAILCLVIYFAMNPEDEKAARRRKRGKDQKKQRKRGAVTAAEGRA